MIVRVCLTYEGKLLRWLGDGQGKNMDLYPPRWWGDCWRVIIYRAFDKEEKQFSRFREALDFFLISLGDEEIEFQYKIDSSTNTTPILWEERISKPTNVTNRKLQLK